MTLCLSLSNKRTPKRRTIQSCPPSSWKPNTIILESFEWNVCSYSCTPNHIMECSILCGSFIYTTLTNMTQWSLIGEDIFSSDITIFSAYEPKVQPFYMRFTFDRFDELMLHHRVSTFSFLVFACINRRVDCIVGSRTVNEVAWGTSQVFQHPPLGHHIPFGQGNKEIKSNMIR